MEALAMELEDDLFFADLSKQISLLIMEDDDGGDQDLVISTHSSSVSLQGFSQSIYPNSAQQALPFVYNQQSCKRESSKGTGVFIPTSLISQPRRKNRQGKNTAANYNSSNKSSTNSSKFQKNLQENSRGLQQLPHHHHHHQVSCNNNSFNPRRF